jgi:hypothetical protein
MSIHTPWLHMHFIYIPQYMLPTVCVATSTTPFHCIISFVYRSIPLRSVWLLSPHTFNVCAAYIPQHTPAVRVATSTTHCQCIISFVHRSIPLRFVWLLPPHTFNVCTTCIPMCGYFVPPHTSNVYTTCIPQHTPTVCVATSTTHLECMYNLYTAAYPYGLCGYFSCNCPYNSLIYRSIFCLRSV